jgi:hypothetical protein
MARLVLLLGALLFAVGCAGYRITGPGGEDGYVVYEPEPYVLVKPVFAADATFRGWEATIEYLPNRSRPYRVRAWGGLGKGDFKFTYEKGWMLTSTQAAMDNTEVLKSIASFLPKPEDYLAMLRDGNGDEPPAREPRLDLPRLFRIEWDCQGRVTGLTEVPVTPRPSGS